MMKHSLEHHRADLGYALAMPALGLLLSYAGSGLVGQWQEAANRGGTPSLEGLLGIACAGSGTLLLAWWLLSLAAAAAAVLLGKRGNARAAAAVLRLPPAFIRRLAVASLSLHLVSGPAAYADDSIPGPHWMPMQEHSASAQRTTPPPAEPGIPVTADMDAIAYAGTGQSPASGVQEAAVGAAPLPSPEPTIGRFPVSASDGSGGNEAPVASEVQPAWQPSAPPVEPGLLAAPGIRSADTVAGPATGQTTQGIQGTGKVAVLAGDTLWDIVSDQLGPGASDVEVALEWPRWYEANRLVIGNNPDMLLPGQLLQPPSQP
ncbi:LysM peptidoglycan-binding domain-containing protein [Pseudarthrobacter enclensis]|uniref:LysM peptidoglycan-binding domain-containing protein n=1 Tax=Pseudarthrobacter enclensis TaxID=993070 RepID=UPI0036AE8619